MEFANYKTAQPKTCLDLVNGYIFVSASRKKTTVRILRVHVHSLEYMSVTELDNGFSTEALYQVSFYKTIITRFLPPDTYTVTGGATVLRTPQTFKLFLFPSVSTFYMAHDVCAG